MKIFKSLILIGLVASSFACERVEVQPVTSAQGPVVQASSNMTLADFAQTMDNASDMDFLRTTEITDHSERGAQELAAKVASGETWAAKPKIKFLWHGTDPHSSGCKKPKGLCIIINLRSAGIMDGLVEVEAKVADGLLFIAFPTAAGDYGVTSDGYLPIGSDLAIPDDVLADLGVTNMRTFVKAGIYAASYDPGRGNYNGVVLELVER